MPKRQLGDYTWEELAQELEAHKRDTITLDRWEKTPNFMAISFKAVTEDEVFRQGVKCHCAGFSLWLRSDGTFVGNFDDWGVS